MTVPTVRRPGWRRIALFTVLGLWFTIGSWTAVARIHSIHGPDRQGTPSAVARIESCDRIGPLSRGGIGYYWVCLAVVTAGDEKPQAVRFDLNELTPDDAGKAVPVVGSEGKYQRSTERLKMPSWVPIVVVGLLVLLCVAGRQRSKRRWRRAMVRHPADVRLSSPVCVLPAATGGGGASGRRVISPGEWSRRKYWRIAGPLVGAGVLAATTAALVSDPEGRRALYVLAAFGFSAPLWLIACTPRWYRTSSKAAHLFVSDTGIGWERLPRDEHFGLNWDEIAEVRVLTVACDGLVLRVVDVFPIAESVLGQRPELWPFWEVGAILGPHRLPGERGAVRLPHAFSEAAVRDLRTAMAAFRPERYREFTAELEPVGNEAPPTPITRGAT